MGDLHQNIGSTCKLNTVASTTTITSKQYPQMESETAKGLHDNIKESMDIRSIFRWITEKFFVILFVVVALNLLIFLAPVIFVMLVSQVILAVPVVLCILGIIIIYRAIKLMIQLLK